MQQGNGKVREHGDDQQLFLKHHSSVSYKLYTEFYRWTSAV